MGSAVGDSAAAFRTARADGAGLAQQAVPLQPMDPTACRASGLIGTGRQGEVEFMPGAGDRLVAQRLRLLAGKVVDAGDAAVFGEIGLHVDVHGWVMDPTLDT